MRISLDPEDPGFYGRTGEDPTAWRCTLDGEPVSAVTADEEQGYVLVILGFDERRMPIVESRTGRVRLERVPR